MGKECTLRVVSNRVWMCGFTQIGMSLQTRFLYSTLDPEDFSVEPPNVNNEQVFSKDVTVYANFKTDLDCFKNAAVVWLPQRSPQSIFVMSVPTQPPLGSLVLAFIPSTNAFYFYSSAQFKMTYASRINYFVLNIDSTPSSTLQISPDLASTFSRQRTYAGMLSVVSDTTSTTASALTGQFHAAAVSQLEGLRSLRVSALSQVTVTKKDAVWGVKGEDGVVSLVGPDIQMKFSSPDVKRVCNETISVIHDKNYTSDLLYSDVQMGSRYLYSNGGFPLTSQTSNTWPVTSWVIDGLTVGPFNAPENTGNSNVLNDFPWFESVDFMVYHIGCNALRNANTVPAQFVGGAAASNYYGVFAYSPCSVQDLWCYNEYSTSTLTLATDNITGGNLNGTVVIPAVSCYFNQAWVPNTYVNRLNFPAAAGTTVTAPPGSSYGAPLYGFFVRSAVHATRRMTYQTQNKQYVGSIAWHGWTVAFNASVANAVPVDGYLNYSPAQNAGPGIPLVGGFQVPVYRSAYSVGRGGPARVLMWENVTSGQNIQLRGIIRTQLVSTGTVAPYASSENEQFSINSNLIPAISEIYNGTSVLFKRVFKGSDYAELKQLLKSGGAMPYESVKDIKALTKLGSSAGLGDLIGGFSGGLPSVLGRVGRKIVPASIGGVGENAGKFLGRKVCHLACP